MIKKVVHVMERNRNVDQAATEKHMLAGSACAVLHG